MTKRQSIQLFEERKVRTAWDDKEEKWYFSVVDVVGILTDSIDYQAARKYWKVLKMRLKKEGNETVTNCYQLKLRAEDGKMRMTDVADQEQLFRIIQSIPSPKAEPFKLWMAHVASLRIDQLQDPELSIEQAVEDYKRLGYDEKWIRQRMQSIRVRNSLTDEWKRGGISESRDYATLTDIITRTWSGVTTRQYRQIKGIDRTKANLRDNMTDVELALNTLAEASAVALSKEANPQGMAEHTDVAKRGGKVAKDARLSLEEQLGHTVISPTNAHDMLIGEQMSVGLQDADITEDEIMAEVAAVRYAK